MSAPQATEGGESLEALVDRLVSEKVGSALEEIRADVARALAGATSDRVTLLVFNGEMDRLLSAFIIATGAAAMGLEVTMYFTFWGTTALRKNKSLRGKPIADKMIAAMLPPGPHRVATSAMNMGGIGPRFFQRVMKSKNVASLPELIELAREMDIKMIACQMAMDVMGIRPEELIDGIEFGGVATYLGDATDSKLTLMI